MSTNPEFPVLLNVTLNETADHCDVIADIGRFRANSVNVSAWQDSLIVEMQIDDESEYSYYLGEAEPKVARRIIPLGFQIDKSQLLTHYKGGKLMVYVAKLDSTASFAGGLPRSAACIIQART